MSDDFWADAEIIHAYTRAQALEDGFLVDVSEVAREAGFSIPAAMTRAVWGAYVEVPEDVVAQDEAGRLWDVVFMAANAARRASIGTRRVPLSNGAEALIDEADWPLARGRGWHQDGRYVVHTTSVDGKPSKLYLHRLILAAPPGYQVDHRNGDGLDNRRSNLRLVTASQNGANADRRTDNASGFRGVSWETQTGKWRALLTVDGRRHSLGRFASIDEAARAYVDAANEFYGEYARHNRSASRMEFQLHVRNDNHNRTPPLITLAAVVGPSDDGSPCLTIMLLEED